LSARVHEINAQLAQQRNTFNLAEWSNNMHSIQWQLTALNIYISHQEDTFKLVDKQAEQQPPRKKKKQTEIHTPEREISYSSLLTPHSVSLKEYMTVDGIVDVPWLQTVVRGQIKEVYNTTSGLERERLLALYTAIWWIAAELWDK
jgi:hypothetical protein